MAGFQKAFHAIDLSDSGIITIQQLRIYSQRMKLKDSFVKRWCDLFDPENSGFITYDGFCETLGLTPERKTQTVVPENEHDVEKVQHKHRKHKVSETESEAEPMSMNFANASETDTNKSENATKMKSKGIEEALNNPVPETFQDINKKTTGKPENNSTICDGGTGIIVDYPIETASLHTQVNKDPSQNKNNIDSLSKELGVLSIPEGTISKELNTVSVPTETLQMNEDCTIVSKGMIKKSKTKARNTNFSASEHHSELISEIFSQGFASIKKDQVVTKTEINTKIKKKSKTSTSSEQEHVIVDELPIDPVNIAQTETIQIMNERETSPKYKNENVTRPRQNSNSVSIDLSKSIAESMVTVPPNSAPNLQKSKKKRKKSNIQNKNFDSALKYVGKPHNQKQQITSEVPKEITIANALSSDEEMDIPDLFELTEYMVVNEEIKMQANVNAAIDDRSNASSKVLMTIENHKQKNVNSNSEDLAEHTAEYISIEPTTTLPLMSTPFEEQTHASLIEETGININISGRNGSSVAADTFKSVPESVSTEPIKENPIHKESKKTYTAESSQQDDTENKNEINLSKGMISDSSNNLAIKIIPNEAQQILKVNKAVSKVIKTNSNLNEKKGNSISKDDCQSLERKNKDLLESIDNKTQHILVPNVIASTNSATVPINTTQIVPKVKNRQKRNSNSISKDILNLSCQKQTTDIVPAFATQHTSYDETNKNNDCSPTLMENDKLPTDISLLKSTAIEPFPEVQRKSIKEANNKRHTKIIDIKSISNSEQKLTREEPLHSNLVKKVAGQLKGANKKSRNTNTELKDTQKTSNPVQPNITLPKEQEEILESTIKTSLELMQVSEIPYCSAQLQVENNGALKQTQTAVSTDGYPPICMERGQELVTSLTDVASRLESSLQSTNQTPKLMNNLKPGTRNKRNRENPKKNANPNNSECSKQGKEKRQNKHKKAKSEQALLGQKRQNSGVLTEAGDGKVKRKRPKRGHIETGRFPKSFTTQVVRKLHQRRRDGAKLSTNTLGKAVKGEQTHLSKKTRRSKHPSQAVKRWKLRPSLRKIGTVVIVLAGRYKGRRAVVVGRHTFSGLLLVTGPYSVNGIPVRRIHPDYVIATKTVIKLTNFRLPKRMQTKSYFERIKMAKTKDIAKTLFLKKAVEDLYTVTEERKQDQICIDKKILDAIRRSSKTSKSMFAYLKSMFSLSKHDYPHKMFF